MKVWNLSFFRNVARKVSQRDEAKRVKNMRNGVKSETLYPM